MPESTAAGIITATATAILALGGLVTAIGVLIPILRNTRENLHVSKITHTIVNQQHTDQQRFIIALSAKLKEHNIEIPIDQSLPVAGFEDAKPGQPK